MAPERRRAKRQGYQVPAMTYRVQNAHSIHVVMLLYSGILGPPLGAWPLGFPPGSLGTLFLPCTSRSGSQAT